MRPTPFKRAVKTAKVIATPAQLAEIYIKEPITGVNCKVPYDGHVLCTIEIDGVKFPGFPKSFLQFDNDAQTCLNLGAEKDFFSSNPQFQ